jgi:hypothetical protein
MARVVREEACSPTLPEMAEVNGRKAISSV